MAASAREKNKNDAFGVLNEPSLSFEEEEFWSFLLLLLLGDFHFDCKTY